MLGAYGPGARAGAPIIAGSGGDFQERVEYWLPLPLREVLQAKLQRVIAQAQARIEAQGGEVV